MAERPLPEGPSVAGSRIIAMWRKGRHDEPDRSPAERLIGPLTKNMPKAGDFSHEAVRRLGSPMPMLVQNNGDTLLELWLEPFGQDYWLRPGEAVMVTSYGHWDSYPFETIHEPDRITVWATSFFATVTDTSGNEVPGAHQRPKGKYEDVADRQDGAPASPESPHG
ncbi:hypothetical protein LRD69_08370 [Streptomyces sp. JH14]|uniref:hypothetical protein n=1 Tax=Streptomyces sp. JH14 TaxID=2793630 RepID=UPI0023F87ABC|nr:hypothetical protein [Streptomyces sp. JH14]MDF6042178.1 hypothetical protein [Streptomyces sp. JH14]